MSSAPSTSTGLPTTSANREFPEPSAPSIDLLTDKSNGTGTEQKDTQQMPNVDSDKKTKGKETGEKKDESVFECNICLDTAKDAVVSLCGHLFCWPCLHQWLETRPTRQLCPVCKAAISKDKVIPLYGRGSTKQEDPRYVYFLTYLICGCLFGLKTWIDPGGRLLQKMHTEPIVCNTSICYDVSFDFK